MANGLISITLPAFSMYVLGKLFMGLFWLVVGGCIFFWQWIHPNRPGFTIWDTGISIGWVALLFGLYNLAFWWVSRANQKRQVEVQEAETRRRAELRKRTHPRHKPDPNLDFSNGSPPPQEPLKP